MKKKFLATILATATTLSFATTTFAVDVSPYNEFLKFRSRGSTQGGTSESYALFDLNDDGIKEVLVKDVSNDSTNRVVTIYVAGKNYLSTYNDNEFTIPNQLDGSFFIGPDNKLYILYRDPENYRMDYLKISRMDYDGDNLHLVTIYDGYDVITSRLGTYGLQDANLYWRDIHSQQSISESDIANFTSGWKNDGRWWYQNSDGSYSKNAWLAIDGAWYYFDGNGYMLTNQWISGEYYVGYNGAMLTNTTTPDGYKVDSTGKWIK